MSRRQERLAAGWEHRAPIYTCCAPYVRRFCQVAHASQLHTRAYNMCWYNLYIFVTWRIFANAIINWWCILLELQSYFLRTWVCVCVLSPSNILPSLMSVSSHSWLVAWMCLSFAYFILHFPSTQHNRLKHCYSFCFAKVKARYLCRPEKWSHIHRTRLILCHSS